MTTIKNTEEAEVLPLESANTGLAKTISLEDFKSVFYLLNAKPDRETKFYKDSKIVSLTDLLELNDLLQEKLRLHNIVTNHVSAIVSLDNNKTWEFETWEQFVREKWHTGAVTKSITIIWDFNVKLERYQLPQRHTVKLRIGSGLRPKDMLELMMNYEEEDQLHQAFAHAVCSIDFINSVISNEIFLIIDNWHTALSKNLFSSKLQNFLVQKVAYIERCVIFLGLTAASTLLYAFSKPFFSLIWHNALDQLFFTEIFGGLLISYLILYLFMDLSRVWATKTVNYIKRIKPSSIFQITRGDENINEENKKKNNKFIKSLSEKIIITIVFNILAFLTSHFIEAIFNFFKK